MPTVEIMPSSSFAAFAADAPAAPTGLRAAISAACRRDERRAVEWLLERHGATAGDNESQDRAAGDTAALARKLVENVRRKRTRSSGVDALMQEFSLSSEEGVALMCLAEALLRIPDSQTADRLIADKISKGDWRRHLGESPSLFVNAATWGLLVTGKLVGTSSEQGLGAAITRLIGKGGEPLIRKGVDMAMRLLGKQFVTGQTIAEALRNGRENEARGYRYSYDMLGEAALTAEDADRYYAAYEDAIDAIGRASGGRGIRNGPGISVKLSALHPRYARAQRRRVMDELLPKLRRLALLAKQHDIGINIDAEESERLELSLDLLEALAMDPALAGFEGIGFVVQAYQKRCPFVIDFVVDLARRRGGRLMVRLVKGAYWDAEIKRAQVDGQAGYPVYTRKLHTDLSYLVCARRLLEAADLVYPQFATHNAQTLASIHVQARGLQVADYEFQCLHGMGEALYDQVVGPADLNQPCRIYAPVGSHRTLLAYLVRRLLENGANSSFVNQIVDENMPVEKLIADPARQARLEGAAAHASIPLPAALYGPAPSARRNSAGFDFADERSLHEAGGVLAEMGWRQWHALPLLATLQNGMTSGSAGMPVQNPADRRDCVGSVRHADARAVELALAAATGQAGSWNAAPAGLRSQMLEDAADLLEEHRFELMALAVREAGKSLPNALAEVREAVDFLRYYAAQAAGAPQRPALGVVVCISPWNFPLAIYLGQVAAALAAGNVVLAKPAEQTCLIAFRATELLHRAGIPRAALQLLPGDGETVGAALVSDARVDGVLFTGSTTVAQSINRTLSRRALVEHRLPVLVAETGGQNALIVDSSALTEQVVQDVLASAFDSAGQRCSALRVLCLQEDVADRTIDMLTGAMRELRIGRPDRLDVDIGPVIDEQARAGLEGYIEGRRAEANRRGALFHRLRLPAGCEHGSFVAPALIGIDDFGALGDEQFGPVLHVLRYRRDDLPALVEAINASGYGLTLGVHSRIDETIERVAATAHVGNIYVNRNIVGAVVGVQPFGGEGKSGTGPKAGGPLYLERLCQGGDGAPARAQASLKKSPPAGAGDDTQVGLSALAGWANAHGKAMLAAGIHACAAASLLGRTIALPGPTGETNTLSFARRGTVLCAATDVDGLLDQLAAVLATGNDAMLPAEDAALLPPDLPATVRQRLRIGAIDDETVPLALALVDQAYDRRLLVTLSQRHAALVPVVVTRAGEPVALWRLVAERALCVNTTAAGGNASLMTLEV